MRVEGSRILGAPVSQAASRAAPSAFLPQSPLPSSSPSSALPAWARGLRLARLGELEARQANHPLWATGHAALDHDLGGGLPRGTITELSGPASGSLGLTGLQHQLLLAARQAQAFTALIDEFDRFDVESCAPELRTSLLWVRGQGRVPQALKAADLLVRDPNFGLLLLDLREAEARALHRVPAQQWYRLQRAVRESDSLLIAFTPIPTIAAAATRLRFQPPTGTELRWDTLRRSTNLQPLASTATHAVAM